MIAAVTTAVYVTNNRNPLYIRVADIVRGMNEEIDVGTQKVDRMRFYRTYIMLDALPEKTLSARMGIVNQLLYLYPSDRPEELRQELWRRLRKEESWRWLRTRQQR